MIDFDDFPIKYGFRYNEDYSEWQKPITSGILILSEKSNSLGIIWELLLCDDNDYLRSIIVGDEDSIILELIRIK